MTFDAEGRRTILKTDDGATVLCPLSRVHAFASRQISPRVPTEIHFQVPSGTVLVKGRTTYSAMKPFRAHIECTEQVEDVLVTHRYVIDYLALGDHGRIFTLTLHEHHVEVGVES